MDKEIAEVLREFGATGLWGIIIYKSLNIIEAVVCLLLIGYGIRKGWPHIKKVL